MDEQTRSDTGPDASVEVPADPAYVATARIFASAVARLHAVADEAVEDVKLAISEACGIIIRGAPPDGSLRVEVRWRPQAVGFEVSGRTDLRPGVPGDTPTPAALGMELVTALFDDATLRPSGNSASILFSVPGGPGR